MIELKEIGVRFSGRDILKDISVVFAPGEIIGLVAPNGTGKSTLMNVMMNYVSPQNGRVIFNKELGYTSKKNEVKIHQLISMMPDQSDLYNYLSGREHLKIYSSMWNSDKQLIDQTIAALDMGSYINKKTGTYSLGMRQRLCFAMQIVSDTQMMLMDEVMNGLDPTQVEIISRILEKKKSEGKTIIVASHLLENLEKYADRIFFFKNSELELVSDLSPGFEQKELTTVRIEELAESVRDILKKEFPELTIQTLPNHVTLINIQGTTSQQLTKVVTFLQEQDVTEFSLRKVSLLDLFSLYYQKV